MPDVVTVSLDVDMLRAVVSALGETLDNPTTFIGSPVREPEHLMRGYFALVRARHLAAGWRPAEVRLAPWAVEAIGDVMAPPKPAKKAPTPKASPEARKRMSAAAKKRHARARKAAAVAAPAPDWMPPVATDDDLTGGDL